MWDIVARQYIAFLLWHLSRAPLLYFQVVCASFLGRQGINIHVHTNPSVIPSLIFRNRFSYSLFLFALANRQNHPQCILFSTPPLNFLSLPSRFLHTPYSHVVMPISSSKAVGKSRRTFARRFLPRGSRFSRGCNFGGRIFPEFLVACLFACLFVCLLACLLVCSCVLYCMYSTYAC